MEVKFKIRGLAKLQAAVKEAPGVLALENLRALRKIGELIKGDVSSRMPEGPGRFGQHAKDSFTVRTAQGPKRQIVAVSTQSFEAKFRELGTKPHDIFPRSGNVLAFSVHGAQVFAKVVHHPGQKPRRILKSSLRQRKPEIKALMLQAIENTTKTMATEVDD